MYIKALIEAASRRNVNRLISLSVLWRRCFFPVPDNGRSLRVTRAMWRTVTVAIDNVVDGLQLHGALTRCHYRPTIYAISNQSLLRQSTRVPLYTRQY